MEDGSPGDQGRPEKTGRSVCRRPRVENPAEQHEKQEARLMVNLSRMRTLIGYERRLQFRYQKKLSSATRITTQLTGMPRASGNHSQVEEGAIELSMVEDAYREVIDELKEMRAELEEMLVKLDNPDDIGIMRLRYIEGQNPEDIPAEINLSRRAMFYHLAGAERKLKRLFPDRIV